MTNSAALADALADALAALRKQCDHEYRLTRAEVGKRLPYRAARRAAEFAAACEAADALLAAQASPTVDAAPAPLPKEAAFFADAPSPADAPPRGGPRAINPVQVAGQTYWVPHVVAVQIDDAKRRLLHMATTNADDWKWYKQQAQAACRALGIEPDQLNFEA